MPHYNKRLETEQGYLNFYLNLIPTAGGDRYHVTVVDRAHKLHSFAMKNGTGVWQIMDNGELPAWILKMEDEIKKAIAEHQDSHRAH